MLTKLKARLSALLATKPGRIVARVAATAAVTFATVAGGLAITSGLFTPAHVVDLSAWGKVLAGGESAAVAAALALVQSLISQALTGLPTVKALAVKVTR